jgi:hypothetical protein
MVSKVKYIFQSLVHRYDPHVFRLTAALGHYARSKDHLKGKIRLKSEHG